MRRPWASHTRPWTNAFQSLADVDAASTYLTFDPIAASTLDDLVLPPGFEYQVIIAYGDLFTRRDERFGFNAHFTTFIPLGSDGSEGLLFVNHEYLSTVAKGAAGVYEQGFAEVVGGVHSVSDLGFDMGASIVHIRRDADKRWVILGSDLNRRLTAASPMIADGPALRDIANVGGTLGNGSGCQTPWHTVLTCEQNYETYVAEDQVANGKGSIGGPLRKNGTHFGWVVEVDPWDPVSLPVKHTGLGRFRHQNVTLRAKAHEFVIAYMGDDRTNGHIYKFVSNRRFIPEGTGNKAILSSGRLFAAVFCADGTGRWIELAPTTALDPYPGHPIPPLPPGATRLHDVYATQGDILIDAFRASNLIGATPTGRPEDLQLHPLDDSLYVAFTANATAGGSPFVDIRGEIVRIVEQSPYGAGLIFTWQRWKAGGAYPEALASPVFAAPNTVSSDRAGNLWACTDISSGQRQSDSRTVAQNSGVFFVPTSGVHAGSAFQFASAPRESELAGLSWTPDERTLFLCIEHPGEIHGMRTSPAMGLLGSNWPHRPHGAPLPAVVAIQRR